MISFDLTREQRAELLDTLLPELGKYYGNTAELRVTPPLDIEEIGNFVRKADFRRPCDVKEAVSVVTEALYKYIVHTSHPRYYGLFNPFCRVF